MRAIASFAEIHLHKSPVDGRKQINGLAAIVEGAMGKDPFGSGLFVFISKRKDLLRLLYWDRSGFAMWTKRLEKERFRWPSRFEGDVIALTTKELQWLLDGIDLSALKRHAALDFSTVR